MNLLFSNNLMSVEIVGWMRLGLPQGSEVRSSEAAYASPQCEILSECLFPCSCI